MTQLRPFEELANTGLLWLINTTVFQPRGYALSITTDDDGKATGWVLLGDGSEAWMFIDEAEVQAKFKAVQAFLNYTRWANEYEDEDFEL